MNDNEHKIAHSAEYFYNEYIDMYCIIGTTYSAQDFRDLEDLYESPDLLEEVEMPEYITPDYDGAEW